MNSVQGSWELAAVKTGWLVDFENENVKNENKNLQTKVFIFKNKGKLDLRNSELVSVLFNYTKNLQWI